MRPEVFEVEAFGNATRIDIIRRGGVITEQIAAAKFAIGERNLHQSNFCGKISWACGFPWMD